MGYFQEERESKKVVFPSNNKYYAEVYTKLNWSDTKQSTKMNNETGEIDIVAGADAFLNRAIKSWNLDDDNGVVVPITPENIDKLDKDDALALIDATGMQAEESDSKKNSTNKS